MNDSAAHDRQAPVIGRAAIIALAVALMTILGTDLYRRVHSPPFHRSLP